MMATAMSTRTGGGKSGCKGAVPTRSCGGVAMAPCGRTFKYATLASRYSTVTTRVPRAIAIGRSLVGFFNSLPAKPTLFHASIENSDPTIAAPTAPTPTTQPLVDQKLVPKFAAMAVALRPMVMPSKISAASAAVLTAVSEVWMNAAVFTPRTLIQVSSTIDAIANSRCGETPTRMSPMGGGRGTVVPQPWNTSAESPGIRTPVNLANATATAAMVPVWMTTNSVQP